MGDEEKHVKGDKGDIPVKNVAASPAEGDTSFLNFLRASNPGSYHGYNDDTLRAGNNSSGHQNLPSNLSELFDAPPNSEPNLQMMSPGSTVSNPSDVHPLPPIPNLPPRPPPSRPEGIHRRDRSVSFDNEVTFHRPVSDTVLFQYPTLNENAPSEDNGSWNSRGTASPRTGRPALDHAVSLNLGQFQRRQPSNRKLTIDDLLGTGNYENEAETNILKALEERHMEQGRHQRFQSETSTILSAVPDNVEHDFSHEDDVLVKPSGSSDNADGDSVSSPRSIRSPRELGRKGRPLLPKTKKAGKRESLHRKTMSVEDRLAGLTMAMVDMDSFTDAERSHSPRSSNNHQFEDDHFGNGANVLAAHASPIPRRNRLNSTGSHMRPLPVLDEGEEAPASDENIDGLSEDTADQGISDDSDPEAQNNLQHRDNKKHKKHQKKTRNVIRSAADKLKDDIDVWRSFFRPRKEHAMAYIRRSFFYIYIPFIGIAAILFYFSGNVPTGKSVDGDPGERASASWWLLFVVRQLVTMSLSLGLQVFIIDFMCIGSRAMLRMMGPLLTLLLVQSKGWPFVVFCWSLLDFGLLYGDNDFVRHWGFFQDYVGLFNDENPSGNIVDSDWNRRVLLIGVCVSIAVAIKRFIVGLFLGRQTFHHYGEQLAKVMNKMVLISEVAQLAKRIYRGQASLRKGLPAEVADLEKDLEKIKGMAMLYEDENDDDNSGSYSTAKTAGTKKLIDTGRRDPLTGSLLPEEKAKIMQLIDRWEEPERNSSSKSKLHISISSVLKFRNALTFIRSDYPFSFAFGPANTREECIESTQEVFHRLLLADPNAQGFVLKFETLALVALDDEGIIVQSKAKEMVRVFRPDRDGCLSILDFTKSIDAVYKEYRLLQASIENSSQIDRAFENIVNVIFYIIIVTVIMSQLGFDPLSLFLSLSSIILAFAFIIGSASSKYFEGLLFILVRRPFGIGDLIHISNVESGSNLDGSIGWLVQHVTLFETTVTWLPTQETASLSNGSLANSRVINWARSPNARFVIFFVIPIETKYEKLKLFQRAVEEYLKVRPREWLAFNAFRVIGVWADQGYMKCEVVVQHRESWQNIGAILDSRGNLISFCHEVQKMLGMEYQRPPTPIQINGGGLDQEDGRLAIDHLQQRNLARAAESLEDNDDGRVAEMFRAAAQQRHNITT